jgi:hypothetical protein
VIDPDGVPLTDKLPSVPVNVGEETLPEGVNDPVEVKEFPLNEG